MKVNFEIFGINFIYVLMFNHQPALNGKNNNKKRKKYGHALVLVESKIKSILDSRAF